MSPQRSQLARLAEQHGKSNKRRATPEPITAQVSQQADQAQQVLQLIEQNAHSHWQQPGRRDSFSLSSAAILQLLTEEFNNNDPEDGRYTPQQCRQDTENSPATTGEFNHMPNTVANEVHQPRADGETSSVYARHGAMQDQLSQSAPTLREHVKVEPVGPQLVDDPYEHAQQ